MRHFISGLIQSALLSALFLLAPSSVDAQTAAQWSYGFVGNNAQATYPGTVAIPQLGTQNCLGTSAAGVIGAGSCSASLPADPIYAVNYGVVCNGTDITTAFQAAVTAAANKTLILPSGTCELSATITSSAPIRIIGQGYAAGPGAIAYNSGTEIFTASAFTAGDVFKCSTPYACVIQDIHFDALTQRTIGAAIHITGSGGTNNANSVIERCSFSGQYIDIQESDASVTTVATTYHQAWSRAAVYTEATTANEPGGGFIYGNYFFGNTTPGNTQTANLEFHSGYENVFGNLILGSQTGVQIAIDAHDAGGIKIHNNWLEEQLTKGIRVGNGNSHAITMLQINDNEFSVVSNGATLQSEISLEAGAAPYLTNFQIIGNTMRSSLTYASTPVYINIQTGTQGVVADNTITDLSGTHTAYAFITNSAQAAAPIIIENNVLTGWTGGTNKEYGLVDTAGTVIDTSGITAANIPTAVRSGSQVFVTDGTPSTACTGSGTGSMGFRQNGAWKCF